MVAALLGFYCLAALLLSACLLGLQLSAKNSPQHSTALQGQLNNDRVRRKTTHTRPCAWGPLPCMLLLQACWLCVVPRWWRCVTRRVGS